MSIQHEQTAFESTMTDRDDTPDRLSSEGTALHI